MDLLYQELDNSDADYTSKGSNVSELVDTVRHALEEFIRSSGTTKNGNFIVKKDVFINVIHAFASLEEVIKGGPSGDKPPTPSNPPSINDKVLERLTAIEKQIQRMQYAQQP